MLDHIRNVHAFIVSKFKKKCDLDDYIDRELNIARRARKFERKILFLGTENSGKTTFIKQILLMNGKEYSEAERKAFIKFIYHNIARVLFTIAQMAGESKIECKTVAAAKSINDILSKCDLAENKVCKEIVAIGKTMLEDEEIKKFVKQYCAFLTEVDSYFLNKLKVIATKDYIPSVEDILKVRVPTTGIKEYTCKVGDLACRMVDVGGQSDERRKWIHSFQRVDAIMFVTAIDEYDKKMDWPENTNKIMESVALFKILFRYSSFSNASFILLLNKMDLFEKKIKEVDMKEHFETYDGSKYDVEDAKQFLKELYIEHDSEKANSVYVHFTTAVNQDSAKKTFIQLKEQLMNVYLNNIILL